MYFEQKEKKRSLWWLYLIGIIAFVVWVMMDESELYDEYPLVIQVELPASDLNE